MIGLSIILTEAGEPEASESLSEDDDEEFVKSIVVWGTAAGGGGGGVAFLKVGRAFKAARQSSTRSIGAAAAETRGCSKVTKVEPKFDGVI